MEEKGLDFRINVEGLKRAVDQACENIVEAIKSSDGVAIVDPRFPDPDVKYGRFLEVGCEKC